MRKAMLIAFIAVGATVGFASAMADDWGLRAVMTTIGAVAGAAIGGAISGIARGVKMRPGRRGGVASDLGTTPDDLMDNYWRDKGRPPSVSALEPEHGRHQFDPDKL